MYMQFSPGSLLSKYHIQYQNLICIFAQFVNLFIMEKKRRRREAWKCIGNPVIHDCYSLSVCFASILLTSAIATEVFYKTNCQSCWSHFSSSRKKFFINGHHVPTFNRIHISTLMDWTEIYLRSIDIIYEICTLFFFNFSTTNNSADALDLLLDETNQFYILPSVT